MEQYFNTKYSDKLKEYRKSSSIFKERWNDIFEDLPKNIQSFCTKSPYLIIILDSFLNHLKKVVSCDFKYKWTRKERSTSMFMFKHPFSNDILHVIYDNGISLLDIDTNISYPLTSSKQICLNCTFPVPVYDIKIDYSNKIAFTLLMIRERLVSENGNETCMNECTYRNILYKLSRVQGGETRMLYKKIVGYLCYDNIVYL